MRAPLAWMAVSLCLAAGVAHAQAPTLERTQGMRLRSGGDLGFSVGAATAFRSDGTIRDVGLVGGVALHGRVGVQLDDYFALYYQAGFSGGSTAELHILGVNTAQEVIYQTNAVFAELTLADVFQVAVGPMLAAGSIAGNTIAALGPAARVGVTFGGRGVGTRQGFTLATQFQILWAFDGQEVGALEMLFGWDTF